MNTVLDPVTAVTHADPYPFYAGLRARGGFELDASLRLWVASSAQAVSEVLADAACRVRPASEPVPAALFGTPMGEVFGRLMRMNDGPAHDAPKRTASPVLAGLDEARVRAQAELCARELLPHASTSDWMHALSPRVLGTLFGCPADELDRLAQDSGRFVAGLSPLATPGQRDAGNAAVLDLLLFMRRRQGTGLLAELQRTAPACAWSDDLGLAANAVGLFSQAYEAAAGWIGNSLVALDRMPHMLERLRKEPELLPAFADEVNRHDPSVQNTRRFVAEPTLVQGRQLKSGDTVLLVLAAANRDSAFNPDGEAFELERAERRCLTFGSSTHACPGDRLAGAIVQGALAAWLASGRALPRATGYRASVNVRIPQFEH